MRRSATGLLLATAACGSDRALTFTAPFPSEIDRAAIVAIDRDGQPHGSGIVARDGAGSFRFELPSIPGNATPLLRLHFAGFSRADIESAAAAVEPARLADTTVRFATERDALLPPARFTASATLSEDGGEVLALDATPPVPLTAAWIPACPTVFSRERPILLDTSCSPNGMPCGASAWQDGCRATIETGSCQAGTLAPTVDGRGVLRFDDAPSCREIAPRSGASRSLECDASATKTCRLDLYGEPLPDRLDVVSREVLDVEPAAIRDDPHVRGYFAGVAAAGDRIVVGTHDGRLGGSWRCEHGRLPDRVLFLDPETLETTGSATVAPCLRQIVADPRGTGFVALHGGTLALARYDERGRLLLAGPLETPPIGPGPVVATDLAVAASGGTLAVTLTGASESHEDETAVVALVDAVTLRTTARSDPFPGHVASLHATTDDVFIAGDERKDRLHFFDNVTAARRLTLTVSGLCSGVQTKVRRAYWHYNSQRLLVSSVGDNTMLFSLQDASYSACSRSLFYEASADILTFVAWPADASLVLAGLTDRGAGRAARVALYAPAEGRYLPGSKEIGYGPVSNATTDARGRVWVTLGWSGFVARIAPR